MIEVKVNPKAKHDRIEKNTAGGYTVWTTAPPDKGAANAAVTRMLAKELGVSQSSVTLKRGATSRRKVFQVE